MSALPLARDPSPAPPAGTFAERLRALRRARGWSQEALSLAAGLDLGAAGRAERGHAVVPRTAGRLADALGLSGAERSAFLAAAPLWTRSPGPARGAFGRRLRAFRERAGLSQGALADLAGVYPSVVNRWESGERAKPLRRLVGRLADALELADDEADDLLAASGYAPAWAGDPTVRQVARLLGELPGPQARRLRAQIAASYRAMRGEGAGDEH